MSGKRVPLVSYLNGEREVVGEAYIEDSGIITGRIDDEELAKQIKAPSLSGLSIWNNEAGVISPYKEEALDPNNGKLYDSVDEAKADGVKNPVEIFGRKKEIAFVSNALSAADKKRRKKQKKNAKVTRKRNR